jgi:hypothetical protein
MRASFANRMVQHGKDFLRYSELKSAGLYDGTKEGREMDDLISNKYIRTFGDHKGFEREMLEINKELERLIQTGPYTATFFPLNSSS